MKCKNCGCDVNEMKEMESEAPEMGLDSESKAKDDVLAELIEMMQGSLADKLKPKAMSVSIIKKPKDEDEDEV